MTERHASLRAQLARIETEMRRQGVWRTQPPPPAAFGSDTPFHADTMDFEDWLQWVMLARFHALVDAEAQLPSHCAIAPMAEHCWNDALAERTALLQLLKELDDFF